MIAGIDVFYDPSTITMLVGNFMDDVYHVKKHCVARIPQPLRLPRCSGKTLTWKPANDQVHRPQFFNMLVLNLCNIVREDREAMCKSF
jgi:hypothetical protein